MHPEKPHLSLVHGSMLFSFAKACFACWSEVMLSSIIFYLFDESSTALIYLLSRDNLSLDWVVAGVNPKVKIFSLTLALDTILLSDLSKIFQNDYV